MPTISKSRYVSGVQCEKKLYYDIYRKELKINASEQQQELFSSGSLDFHIPNITHGENYKGGGFSIRCIKIV